MARGGVTGRQGTQQPIRKRGGNYGAMDDGPRQQQRENRPRRQLTKRTPTVGGRGAQLMSNRNLNADLDTILRNQKFIMQQYRKLSRGTLQTGSRPQQAVATRRSGQGRYFDSRNIALRQRGTRRGRGGPSASRASTTRQQQQVAGPRRPTRGGARGGRGGRRPATVEDLDKALDAYMGEDVQKQRLDSDLDSYFAKAGAADTAGKNSAPETGEITH